MNQINETQIEKLMGDIASIKSIIRENQPVLKQLFLPIHFRVISYIGGLGIIIISMAYYYLLKTYEMYSNIPDGIKTVMLVLIALLWLTLGILKGVLWVKSVHTVNKELSFGQMVKTLYSDQILHAWIPTGVLIAFFSVYFYRAGTPQYAVPVVAFGVGFIYNMIGGMVRIWQYLLTGYWLIFTGVLSVLYPNVSSLVWLSLSVGVGMLLFGIVSKTQAASEKE